MLSIVECIPCGLAWQYPISRSTAESVEYFTAEYGDARSNSYFDKSVRESVARLQLGFVQSLRPDNGRLLDVGAGDGTFVRLAADVGWQCTGSELATSQVQPYTAISGGSARMVTTSVESLAAGQFDVVTLWDVIEHVERPLDVIRSCVDALASNGVLIIETGNYHSADRIEGGDRWWCYQADHRWYFSPSTIAPLLKCAGLAHAVLADRVFRPWWTGSGKDYRAPSLWTTGKRLLKSPRMATESVKRHLALRRAETDWQGFANLGIFTIAASRRQFEAAHSSPLSLS